MAFEEILFVVGELPVTYGRLLLAGAGLGLVLLISTVLLAWQAGLGRRVVASEAMLRTGDLYNKLADLS